jgi:hypothetical protein
MTVNTMAKVIMMTKIIVKVLGMIDNMVHKLIPPHRTAITITTITTISTITTIMATTRAQIGKTMFKTHLHLRHHMIPIPAWEETRSQKIPLLLIHRKPLSRLPLTTTIMYHVTTTNPEQNHPPPSLLSQEQWQLSSVEPSLDFYVPYYV